MCFQSSVAKCSHSCIKRLVVWSHACISFCWNPHKIISGAETHHRFTAAEEDWGFKKFIELSTLENDKDGYLPNGELSIRVEMTVSLEDKFTGGSRAVTNHVGLKNQVPFAQQQSICQMTTPEKQIPVHQRGGCQTRRQSLRLEKRLLCCLPSYERPLCQTPFLIPPRVCRGLRAI
jgi:hypothetical protein